MKRLGKWSALVLILIMATAGMLMACGDKTPKAKGNVAFGGLTADADGAFSVVLNEKESRELTIIVGTVTGCEFTVENTAPDVVTATATATQLVLQGVSGGTATVTLSDKSGQMNDATVKVTVEAAEKVAPTGLNMSNIIDGSGTISDPYTVTFADNGGSSHNLVTSPAGADSTFTWTVGAVEADVFTENADLPITAVQQNATLKLTAAAGGGAGTYYVRGVAATGSLTVYLQVTVTEYTALTGITTDDLTESEEEEYDYYFKTAKGTAWDIAAGMAQRGKDNLAGSGTPGGYQKPLNLTYYPSLYRIEFAAEPANATDTTWVFRSADDTVFEMNADGSYQAKKAGSTVVTVTNLAGEADVKIKVDVEDTLYNGVLLSEFNKLEAADTVNWNFDQNPDDYDFTKGMLEDWQLVMVKTTSDPNGDDGNQKIFYLGNATRVYGVCIETRIDSDTGVSVGTTGALMWTKAAIGAGAGTVTACIGNNDKTHGRYRIVMVEENGTVHDVSGWVDKTKANDDGKPLAEYTVPEACKGKTVAIVIETARAQANDNGEIHVKGLWINQYVPVQSVTLDVSSAEVGQSGTYKLHATVAPADATEKGVTYAVTASAAGGEGKVTVAADGTVSVAADAPLGTYTVTATSKDDETKTATFTLTVITYVPLTSFDGKLLLHGREIEYGSAALKNANVHATVGDDALDFEHSFAPANASRTDYRVSYTEEGIATLADGKLTFVAVGTTTITVIPEADEELSFTFTVTVAENAYIEGTKLTATTAAMLGTDTVSDWTGTAIGNFIYKTVDTRHGGAKYNFVDDNTAMQLESHVVEANSDSPVNIGYNKVTVAQDATVLTFKTRGHNDDRLLESANVRVQILYVENEAWTADKILDWTTVANRWKQKEEWYQIALDVTKYRGKEIVVLFEAVGGLQNNGNFPKGSDSAAGGYLYLKDVAIANETPAGAITADEIANGTYARMYGNKLSADGWTVNATKESGCYNEGTYVPFKLTYGGSLAQADVKKISLSTTTFYSNSIEAKLAPWGVFPALNNTHTGHTLVYTSSEDSIFTVSGGELTPVANGTATLTVAAYAYGSDTEKVTFTVAVEIAAVSQAVRSDATSVTVEVGKAYTLRYTTIPENTPVTFALQGAADGASVTSEGVFTATASGDYTVRIAFTSDETVYLDIAVKAQVTTAWADKTALLDPNTGWTTNGGFNAGPGEGVDFVGGGYIGRTVDVTSLNTLTVNFRIFNTQMATPAIFYVDIVHGGETTRLAVASADGDDLSSLVGNTTIEMGDDGKFDRNRAFTYDVSGYTGSVEIRIGTTQGSHGIIASAALN